MKHIIIILMAVLFIGGSGGVAQAETDWRPTNQGTLTWEPSTLLSDDNPIPSSDVITYNVYIKKADGTGQTQVGTEVPCCSHTISFATAGKYLAGLSTVRVSALGTKTPSFIIWSNDPTYAAVPFGYEYSIYAVPAGGLAPQ